jgi:hypothetical protein
MVVEVVNMRTCDPPWGQPGDVRIDRTTKWGNPYPVTTFDTRATVITRYAFYLRNAIDSGELDIAEIANAKRLGCWCKPKACHGDVLKKAILGLKGEAQMRFPVV